MTKVWTPGADASTPDLAPLPCDRGQWTPLHVAPPKGRAAQRRQVEESAVVGELSKVQGQRRAELVESPPAEVPEPAPRARPARGRPRRRWAVLGPAAVSVVVAVVGLVLGAGALVLPLRGASSARVPGPANRGTTVA